MTDPNLNAAIDDLCAPGALPRFDLFTAEAVVPAFQRLIPELEAALDRLEAAEALEWTDWAAALERLTFRLEAAWGVVSHLQRVRSHDALRQAYAAIQGDAVRFDLRVRQSEPIYRAARRLRDEATAQDTTRDRILGRIIREAEHAGIALQGHDRDRFNTIEVELAELSNTFRNNLMDSIAAWEHLCHDPQEIHGLPDTLRRLMAHDAARHGHPDATPEAGPWRLSLSPAVYHPFLTYSARRDLRERLYRAMRVRATEEGRDNRPLIVRILHLRAEQARLLGFDTFAQLSLAAKMAPSVEAVHERLRAIEVAARPAAAAEIAALRDFAAERGAPEAHDLRPWDLPYWSDQARKARYDYDAEALRAYLPLESVLEGLFDLTRQVFGVRVTPADPEDASTWHEDVRTFWLLDDATQERLAFFYLDPFARPGEKAGGAWHSTVRTRSTATAQHGDALQLPVSCLVCNQTPPTPGRPSLMTFAEVNTLFHEFGHGLHNMLTQVDQGLASGMCGVEWDFVEVPSKFMENWCTQPDLLRRLGRHVETGEPLPEHLIQRLLAARNFMSGHSVLMQLYLSDLDLTLHAEPPPTSPEDVQARFLAIRDAWSQLPGVEDDAFLCAFAHIFAGGYAAGYYSYNWSEVLSADAFACFEEAGLDDPAALQATGRRYRDTILARGGSQDPAALFDAFAHRPPAVDAFLRHNGLTHPRGVAPARAPR